MAGKENKAIKQLKKQLDKLKERVDKMSSKIKALQVIAENIGTEQAIDLPEECVQEALTVPHFSEKEVETADEMTWAAEEFADVKEKKKEEKKRNKRKEKK